MIILALEEQRIQMVAALWSNSNLDDGKQTRSNMIRDLNNSHQEAIAAINDAIDSDHERDEADKIDDKNPFFAASKRGLEKVDKVIESYKKPPKPEEINYMKGLDQE